MKSISIALLGHRLDSSNLGVDALTRAHLTLLSEIAASTGLHIDACIFSWTDIPESAFTPFLRVRQTRLPRKVPEFLKDWRSARRIFGKFDLCIDLSEGDSFSDIYGNQRAYVQTIDKLLALRAGLPLVIAPMTIGPFSKPLWKRVARSLVGHASVVFTRDWQSSDCARRLGRGDVCQASDLAFLLPYTAHEQVSRKTLRVGLNVSQLLWSGGYTGKNQFSLKDDYPTVIRRLVAALLSHPQVELHLVPHVLAADFPVEDDRTASAQLHRENPQTIVAPHFADSIEAKTYIATLDFFVGSRMHACIAAFSSGVPVVPLAYSRKFEGLFSSLGYARTVDLRAKGASEVVEQVVGGLRNLEELREEVRDGARTALDLLAPYKVKLQTLLADIGSRKH